MMGKLVGIWDNGGKTVDRYTILVKDGNTWYCYGASSNPSSPQGFGQYVGESKHLKDYSGVWNSWGKRVELQSIPKEVRGYVKRMVGMV